MILMRVSLVVLLALLVVFASSSYSYAEEQLCTALGANCVCSEPYNTNNLVRIEPSWYNPADSTVKECTAEVQKGYAIARNSDNLIASNDPTVLGSLPPGHQVNFFVRGRERHAGIFMAGSRQDLDGSKFIKRAAARWYIYHSPGFEFAQEGLCQNSKMAQFDSGLLLDKSFGQVHMYNFTTWTPAQDCCFVGPGPQNVQKQDWRGKWWRVEVVFINRLGGNPGWVGKVYMKNVTDNTPEITVVNTSMPGTQLIQSNTRTPPNRMDGMLSNNYRQGTCNGWLGISHYMLAGWDTDQGQRIGPAIEIEGGGTGDVTPPTAPTNLRVQ
jgi:hypothetical protein